MNDFTNFNERIVRDGLAPVIDTMPADLHTPLSVFLKISNGQKNAFLLESVEGGERLARYSFVGAEPDFVISSDGNSITHAEPSGQKKVSASMIDHLRGVLDKHRMSDTDELPPFLGGLIGYLGFDCVEWFEPSLRSERPSDSRFMAYSSVIAFDHVKQVIQLIRLVRLSDTTDAQRLFDEAKERNRRLRTILETTPIQLPVQSETETNGEVSSNFERKEFENAVTRGKEYIFAGDCYQVVLSQKFSRPTVATDVSIYRAIRSTNPSPYMFLLRFEDRSIIGASPEMLVRCTGNRLEYRPIAGTRRRGKTPQEDARLAEEMSGDQKEVAEHLMLVDLGRNDLGRIAEYGSVKVDELMKVEKYSHVQHLVSSLSAKLRDGCDRFDALASCFPAGTVSGAPKVRSVEIIRELEPNDRGIYAGAVGYFDYSGNMDTCIAIRTLVLENGVATIQAGAGIVADSIPAAEYEETVNKAKALLKAVEIAESGEF